MRAVLITVGSIVGVIALIFVLNLAGLEMTKFFAPKFKEVEREVYEETPSRVLSMNQQLGRYHYQWKTADDQKDKDAIEALIRVQFSEFESDKVNDLQLRSFLVKTRGF